MESNIINQWEKHKCELDFYFKTHKMSEYDEYENIFMLVIKFILNGGGNSMNISDKITVIDDGIVKVLNCIYVTKTYISPK